MLIVAPLVDSQHFLNLRLGLQYEVLRAPAAHDEHPTLPTVPLSIEDETGGFVDIGRYIVPQLVTLQRELRHVHPDGRIAG